MTIKIQNNVESLLVHLPDTPGIYQYFDKNNTLLYIGKAKNLKNRVRSYFSTKHIGKTKILVSRIFRIEYTVVETEQDALLLENNLIKEHQPPYNIRLKDDKTYPWICIKKERFPRVIKTRKLIKGDGLYFGPYTNIKIVYVLLELFYKHFKVRTCAYDLSEKNISNNKFRACMEFQIGNCKAPCINKQTETDYLKNIELIKSILKGNTNEVIVLLENERNQAATNLNFESAHDIQVTLNELIDYQSKSTVANRSIINVDVIGYFESNKRIFINYLRVIKGAIIYTFSAEVKGMLEEGIEELLSRFYLEMKDRFQSDAAEIISKVSFIKLNEVDCTVPQKGDKFNLLELSERNAKYYGFQKLKADYNYQVSDNSLLELMSILHLPNMPEHIECFDNSNIQGTNPASACVVFKNGKPSKSDYRKFTIKTVVGPDDFASMYEVVYRRYYKLKTENLDYPQLIVIDGGKGQLSSAYRALEELGLIGEIAIIGIAKRLEEIFVPGDKDPLFISKKSDALRLIQHMRNEAHRFSLGHHRTKRSNTMLQTELLDIQGIGQNTYEKLMIKFKSIQKLKKASLQQIQEEIGASKAKLVFEYLNS